MYSHLLRRVLADGADAVLDGLSTWQHLNPHDPVARAVEQTGDRLGVCPDAARQAMTWLCIDGTTKIGRLRRTELHQLARTIHRFWRQAGKAKPSMECGG